MLNTFKTLSLRRIQIQKPTQADREVETKVKILLVCINEGLFKQSHS